MQEQKNSIGDARLLSPLSLILSILCACMYPSVKKRKRKLNINKQNPGRMYYNSLKRCANLFTTYIKS